MRRIVVPPFDVDVEVMIDAVQGAKNAIPASASTNAEIEARLLDALHGRRCRLSSDLSLQDEQPNSPSPVPGEVHSPCTPPETPLLTTDTTQTPAVSGRPTAQTGAIADLIPMYQYLVPGGIARLHTDIATAVAKESQHAHDPCLVHRALDVCDRALHEWRTAHCRIVDDVVPFVDHAARLVVLGGGALMAKLIVSILQRRQGVLFWIVGGLPEMPHETLRREQRGGGNPVSEDEVSELFLTEVRRLAAECGLCSKINQGCALIPVAAGAHYLSDADALLLGAYSVTENGGVIHRVGSHQLALIAKSLAVPVYVACESYKFTSVYPLGTDDIAQPSMPDRQKSPYLCSHLHPKPSSSLSLKAVDDPAQDCAVCDASVASGLPCVKQSNSSPPPTPTRPSLTLAGHLQPTPPPSPAFGHHTFESDTIIPPCLEFLSSDLITLFFTDLRPQPPCQIVTEMYQSRESQWWRQHPCPST